MSSTLKSKNLIIIASQPRSGSTLLQAILSNNNTVGTVSEPWLLLPFLGYTKIEINNSKYSSYLANKGISDFKTKIGAASFDNDLASFLLQQYGKVLHGNEHMVLDKTPRYYEILDEILNYFPNCKIIILKRHPFAVLNSIIKTWKVSELNGFLEFKRDILNAPFILQNFAKKHETNSQVYQLRYEDLVSQPEKQMEALCQWLELPFSKEMLNYGGNKKYHGYLGDPKGVKQAKKPNINSLNEWEALFQDSYWKEFVLGYHDYLSTEFLRDYGNYTVESISKAKSTKMFSIFLERSKWSFLEHEAPRWRLLKYSFQRRLGLLKY